ncbi:hypothetical protein [Saccharopolyspora phatthalungensis]|uniref:Uncharacterized protein n=1 Tax=Saccharopolyspora phatthalungensis TaxID=664693 RepID=A0A840QFE0_9PSEU|nr:hypothetical protein [Saccharopolyspora phatthalungensis]MBB5159146.1 hypothetical protein [Saccharopolyspora phatthalungensis]
MADRHRRTGIIAAGVMWTGELFQQADSDGLRPAVEPGSPARHGTSEMPSTTPQTVAR